jgi:hypothetical protein
MCSHRFLPAIALLWAAASPAAPLFLSTGPARVPLIELFTSQGCSSCPPADAWLSGLARRQGLWHDFVPVAWHVDYWNSLGWKDRFSRPAYSRRQRDYRAHGAVRVVYTPGVFAAGKEWRNWDGLFAGLPETGAAVGRLSLRLDGTRAELVFKPSPGVAATGLHAHLALLGMGLETPVARGENSGRSLHEDFVVLGTSEGVPLAAQPQSWRLDLPAPGNRGAARLAVAAWISRGNDPAPLQALGGWLP